MLFDNFLTARWSDKYQPMSQRVPVWSKAYIVVLAVNGAGQLAAAEELKSRADTVSLVTTRGPYATIDRYCQHTFKAAQRCTDAEGGVSECWPKSIVCDFITRGPYAPKHWPEPSASFLGFGTIREELKPSNGNGDYHLALRTAKGWYVARLGLPYNIDRGRDDSAIVGITYLPTQDGASRVLVRSITAAWYTDKQDISRFDCAGQVTVCGIDSAERPFCSEALTVAFLKNCSAEAEQAPRRWHDWERWPWQLDLTFPTEQTILLREPPTAHDGPPRRDLYVAFFSDLVKLAKARIGHPLKLVQR